MAVPPREWTGRDAWESSALLASGIPARLISGENGRRITGSEKLLSSLVCLVIGTIGLGILLKLIL